MATSVIKASVMPTLPATLNKPVEWAKRNAKALKIVFYVFLGVAVVYVASSQLRGFDWAEIKSAAQDFAPVQLFGMVFLGLLAFAMTGFYDVVGSYFVSRIKTEDEGAAETPDTADTQPTSSADRQPTRIKPVLPFATALKIGWQAQALNNFVGLGGLTGGTIRTKAYIRHGVDNRNALRVTLTVWIANLLGLFALIVMTAPLAVHYERALATIPLTVSVGFLLIYLFGHKVKIGKLDLTKTPLGYMPLSGKTLMLGASVIDWMAAALFFYYAVQSFIPDVHMWTVIFIYSMATLVGLISFVPSGLGTFDVTVLTMFSLAGFDVNKLLVAIIFYRLIYYALPWALASLHIFFETWDRHFSFEVYSRGGQLICTVLSLGLIISGLLLIASTLTPEVIERVHFMHEWIPKDVMRSSRFTTLLIGILLIFLSRGIFMRVRRAYLASVALLAVGIVTVLLKGLDYEEAIILFVFGVLLMLANRYFTAEPLRWELRSAIWTIAVLLGVPLLIYGVRNHTSLLNAHVDIAHATHLWGHFAVVTFVLVAIVIVAMFTSVPNISFEPPTAQDVRDFDALIENYGGNEYSNLFYLYDKTVFFNSAKTVAFLYYPVRDHVLVLGDPIGKASDFSNALDELLSYCASNRYDIAFYQASGRLLEEYWDRGLAVVKIGEDAAVELASVPFKGNKGRKFRRMLNYMKTNGMSFEMWKPPYTLEQLEQLEEVSREWLGKRDEMGYSLGYFDPEYISRTPIAVVRSENRLEGFATICPIDGKTISIDLMRYRPDSPHGVMDGIFIHLIQWALEEGFTHFYLGMAPMANDGTKVRWRQSDKVVRYIFWLGKSLYNFEGLREYKDKFGPQWRSRYLVYTSQRQLPGVISGLLEAVRKPVVKRYVADAPTEPIGPIGRGEALKSPAHK